MSSEYTEWDPGEKSEISLTTPAGFGPGHDRQAGQWNLYFADTRPKWNKNVENFDDWTDCFSLFLS